MAKIEEKKLSDFHTQEENANVHTERGLQALGDAYSEVGYVAPMTAAANGEMLDGSARLEKALDQFDDEALVIRHDGSKPVIMIREDVKDANDPKGKRISYGGNRIGEIDLAWDPVQVLADIDAGVDLSGLFDEVEIEELLAGLDTEPPGEPPEPQIDKASELKAIWGTELGQIWQLGDHRLACGDCTDRAVVQKVMGNDRAHLFLTDPPYGVSYADKNAFLNTLAKGNAVQKRIENDHQSMDDMKLLWYEAAKNARDFSKDTASYYWFACQGGDQMMMMMMMIGDAGWKVRHELMWLKNNHVLGRSDYQYKHEPILYGWKRDGTHKFYGGFQTSVLEFNKPTKSDLHPTTKPVELIKYLVSNSTQKDDMIYDPFLGSGTTLIAGHQLNRRCIGIEIDPGYTAVCLQRFSDLTNIKAELISESV